MTEESTMNFLKLWTLNLLEISKFYTNISNPLLNILTKTANSSNIYKSLIGTS